MGTRDDDRTGARGDPSVGSDAEVARWLEDVEHRITRLDRVLVAVSGGVDSTVVAEVAARTLGPRALTVTADSPAVPRADLEHVRRLAWQRGWRHQVVRTGELDRDGYRRNDTDRCYHCKTELFATLRSLPEADGATILTGTNADDLGDHRPGLRAADEHGVIAPLVLAGLGKPAVRALARALDLPTAERPASPCLASRIAYGVEVDPDTLDRIERGERTLHRYGFPVVRLRVHGDIARIEVPSDHLVALVAQREAVLSELAELGFTYLTIDLQGFRSGSLNEGLPLATTR